MLKRVTVKVPEYYLEKIALLVEKGHYISKTEAIRIAIRDYIWQKL